MKCDPEAAQAVFSNPDLAGRTTLIPLDLTHKVLATQQVQQDLLSGRKAPSILLHSGGLNLRQLFHEILIFFAKTYSEVFGLVEGPPLHDPIAVAVLLDGLEGCNMFDDLGGERWHLKVVTDGEHSFKESEHRRVGMTVVTPPEAGSGCPGVRIPRGIQLDRFWTMIESCMQRAEKAITVSPDGSNLGTL